jgi:AraC-like DNA-binding protein
MHILAILLIGYSVFSALVIVLTHFRQDNYTDQKLSQVMGTSLLLVLGVMQLLHFAFLQYGADFIHGATYSLLLFAVAPLFYLFSKPLLQAQTGFHPRQVLHLLPLIVAPLLPFQWALPLAFAVGAGYLLWLARCVYALRSLRGRFRLELAVLGTVFVIALLVFAIGLSLPLLGEQLFFTLYAGAIGCAFLLVSLVLGFTPRLAVDVTEAARETYAVSTLTNLDCAAALAKLDALMGQERIYQQPELDLPNLATRIGLSAHQLSELINTRLGKGFSRYLREHRIEAAKDMLLSEPSASVLSVGLSAGFISQSNFYDAFREITGMTPGKFRKLRLQKAPE